MNPTVKKMWLDALRDGSYEQGAGHLSHIPAGSTTRRFCCLGVLCDLGVKAGVVKEIQDIDPDIMAYGQYQHTAELPEEVVEWSGLSTDNPAVKFGVGREFLANLNDHGTPFTEIADLIEASY
jgi:hypothetical protein